MWIAKIAIDCKVGRDVLPSPPLSPSPVAASKLHRSPSYYRRQARRKAEREIRACNENSVQPIAVADQAMQETRAEDENLDIIESAVFDSDEEVGESMTGIEVEAEAVSNEDSAVQTTIVDQVKDDDEVDISVQLDSIIRQSQLNRDLWEKYNSLPS